MFRQALASGRSATAAWRPGVADRHNGESPRVPDQEEGALSGACPTGRASNINAQVRIKSRMPNEAVVRCAVYTRVSTEAGLRPGVQLAGCELDAAQAYIRSQAHAGWSIIRTRYDDGVYLCQVNRSPCHPVTLAL